MITVDLRLFGDFRKFVDSELGKGYSLEVDDCSTIRSVVVSVGIPMDEVKIILVNGRSKEIDYVLSDGDRLALFPPVAGG